MDFKFANDEEQLRFAARDFAERELATRELNVFDQSLKGTLKKMGELGFFSIRLPEEYGGDPGSWVMLGILAEEIAKVNAVLAHFILVSHQLSFALATYGSEEAKEEWLSDLIKGNKIGCLCATEPNTGTDFEAISTRAQKDGDQYLISGVKAPVTFGMEADVGLSFLKIDEQGDKDITAMIVPLTLSGVGRVPISQMGLRLSSPASLTFNKVAIPMKYRVGEEGEGLHVNATSGLLSSTNKTLTGLISLGMAQTALSLAVRYSKQRVAFGRPIAQFEGVSHKLAENATMVEAGRWLCYRALLLKDQKRPHAKEAAMCGWWCPKVAYQVIHDSLQIHGHSGYCDDHPFEEMFRDIIGFEMISGTEQILKLIIGYETIGNMAVRDSVSECMRYHRAGGME